MSAAGDLCSRYLASFASGNPDTVAAFVTEDFVNEHTAALGSSCQGRDEYRRRLPGFIASMPGLRYEVQHVIAEGDEVCAAYVLRATVNGREVAVRGMMHFSVRSGAIARRTDYWDSTVFLRQAGLETS
jgi:steroid delta-isomerase-like uncharacterized protein